MALNYVTITGTFDDGSGAPLSGSATFTPSETVYASGVPVASVSNPVSFQIANGVLTGAKLLATDNTGLSFEGLTGFFYWSVVVTLNGVAQPGWSFSLPHLPATVDLYALANTAAGGFSNPMTTLGDLIDGGASGAAQRLPIGASSQVLQVVSGAPAWGAVPDQPWQFRPENYGAKGNGKVVSDVVTNSTTTITSATANFTSADVGKYIMIHGANGATSGPLITTISSFTNSTTVVLAAAATASVSNCPAVYGTDDTAAINSAITAAGNYAQGISGGPGAGFGGYFAEVLFSSKIYILSTGPTQVGNGTTTPTFNSQLPLPYPAADGHTQKLIIQLTGAGDAGWNQYWESSIPSVAGSALVSMLVGPTNADPTFGRQSVIGGPTSGAGFTSGLGQAFANIKPVARNLSIWLPILTNTRAWDFGFCSAARAQQCNAHVFAPTGADNKGVQPYQKNLPGSLNVGNTGSTGWVMPVNQNNTDVTMSDCAVAGYGFGFSVADWFAADHLTAIYCDTAMYVNQGGGIGHLIHVGQLDAEAYNRGVRTNGSGTQTCALDINLFAECTGVVADVDDAGNYFRGVLHFQDAAIASRGITVNGAANLKIIADQLGPGHWTNAVTGWAVPAAPASTVSQQNTAWRDAWVTLSATTGITVITVDGTTTGLTAGNGVAVSIRVPSGKSYAVTYTGTLTTQWWLD